MAEQISAHPPEFHRRSVKSAAVKRSTVKFSSLNSMPDDSMLQKSGQDPFGQQPSEQQPSDQDRVLAMRQYQFLADLARRCPLRIQTQVLDHLLDEHRLATQAPLSCTLNELLNNRAKLREELRQRIVTLSAS